MRQITTESQHLGRLSGETLVTGPPSRNLFGRAIDEFLIDLAGKEKNDSKTPFIKELLANQSETIVDKDVVSYVDLSASELQDFVVNLENQRHTARVYRTLQRLGPFMEGLKNLLRICESLAQANPFGVGAAFSGARVVLELVVSQHTYFDIVVNAMAGIGDCPTRYQKFGESFGSSEEDFQYRLLGSGCQLTPISKAKQLKIEHLDEKLDTTAISEIIQIQVTPGKPLWAKVLHRPKGGQRDVFKRRRIPLFSTKLIPVESNISLPIDDQSLKGSIKLIENVEEDEVSVEAWSVDQQTLTLRRTTQFMSERIKLPLSMHRAFSLRKKERHELLMEPVACYAFGTSVQAFRLMWRYKIPTSFAEASKDDDEMGSTDDESTSSEASNDDDDERDERDDDDELSNVADSDDDDSSSASSQDSTDESKLRTKLCDQCRRGRRRRPMHR